MIKSCLSVNESNRISLDKILKHNWLENEYCSLNLANEINETELIPNTGLVKINRNLEVSPEIEVSEVVDLILDSNDSGINMIEIVFGFKLAAVITLIYIINILTLNCMLIKWLNGDIIDHLFHFIHDNHDHKFDNTNGSILASLHNSESLNLTDTFDVIRFKFTDSTLNLNEFLLNIFIFLLTLLIFLCKFNNMTESKKAKNYDRVLSNEPKIICNNTLVEDDNSDQGFKIEIRNINSHFNDKIDLNFDLYSSGSIPFYERKYVGVRSIKAYLYINIKYFWLNAKSAPRYNLIVKCNGKDIYNVYKGVVDYQTKMNQLDDSI